MPNRDLVRRDIWLVHAFCMLAAWSQSASGAMLGEYGFLSNYDLRSTCVARQYVRDMKNHFGVREFLFRDIIEGYSYPPSEYTIRSSWRSTCFTCNRQKVDKAIVKAYIDEVQNHEPRGRAWLRVDAMAENPATSQIPGEKVLGYIMSNGHSVVNVVSPDADLAEHEATHWAYFATHLGFQGIHWSSWGNFRGCAGCDWRNFLVRANQTLGQHGLVQNLEFVDGFQYDDTLFTGNYSLLQFPVWSVHNSNMSSFVNHPRSGAIGMYSAAHWNSIMNVAADAAINETIQLMHQAHCADKSYAALADGARSLLLDDDEQWPFSLSASQIQVLEAQWQNYSSCPSATRYAGKNMTGVHKVVLDFNLLCEDVNSTHLGTLLRDSLPQMEVNQSEADKLEIIIGVEPSGDHWFSEPSGTLQLTIEGRNASTVSEIRNHIKRLPQLFMDAQQFRHEALPYLSGPGCNGSLIAWWPAHSSQPGSSRIEETLNFCLTRGHPEIITMPPTPAPTTEIVIQTVHDGPVAHHETPLWANIMGGIVFGILSIFACCWLYHWRQGERAQGPKLLSQGVTKPPDTDDPFEE